MAPHWSRCSPATGQFLTTVMSRVVVVGLLGILGVSNALIPIPQGPDVFSRQVQSADTFKNVEDRAAGSFDKLSNKIKVVRDKEADFESKFQKDFKSKQKKTTPAPAPAPLVFEVPKEVEAEATSSVAAKPRAAATPAPPAAPKPKLVPASSLYETPAPTPNKGGEIFTAGLAAAATAAFFAKRSEGIQGTLESDGPTLAEKIEAWQSDKFDPQAFEEKWKPKSSSAPTPAPVVEEAVTASEPAPAPAAEPAPAPVAVAEEPAPTPAPGPAPAEITVDEVEVPPVQARTSAAGKQTDKYVPRKKPAKVPPTPAPAPVSEEPVVTKIEEKATKQPAKLRRRPLKAFKKIGKFAIVAGVTVVAGRFLGIDLPR